MTSIPRNTNWGTAAASIEQLVDTAIGAAVMEANTYTDEQVQALAGVTPETIAALNDWAGEGITANDANIAGAIANPTSATRAALENRLVTAPVVVYHDDNAAYPRPDTSRVVMWVGTAIPLGRRAGDILYKAAPESAPFTPAMLDLIAWYDAAEYEGSDPVTTIPDKSGRGIHLTTKGGAGSITVDESTLALPSFAFDGDAYISSDAHPIGLWSMPVAVFVVLKLAVGAGSQVFFDGTTAARNNLYKTGTRIAIGQGTANLQSDTGQWPDATVVASGVWTGSANETRAYINGVLKAGPGAAGTAVPVAHRIGANFSGASPITGNVGEVIIARNVSDDDHDATVTYLMDRWGIAP